MNGEEKLYLELSDYVRIRRIIEKTVSLTKSNKQHFIRFLSRLDNAGLVHDGELSDDIVKINSYIQYRFTEENQTREGVLVFPADVASDPKNFSILTPIGLALVGRRKNSTLEYCAPGGLYRIEIKEVIHKKQHASV